MEGTIPIHQGEERGVEERHAKGKERRKIQHGDMRLHPNTVTGSGTE